MIFLQTYALDMFSWMDGRFFLLFCKDCLQIDHGCADEEKSLLYNILFAELFGRR